MMKPLALTFAALLAAPAFAQQTGVAAPPESSVQDLPPVVVQTPAAAPAVPAAVAAPTQTTEVYGEYKPYAPATPVLKPRVPENDPDAGIVTEVPHVANQLPAGTQLRMRLNADIDTNTTQPETRFTGEVIDEVKTDGRVVIPAASTVEGRITQIRGGKRIYGTALIHLQIDDVLMPDGTRLPLRAQVIDTDQFQHTRTDSEGNILRKDHAGATLTAMSLTTGGAAAAGGVMGGPAGALIGAGVGAGLSTVVWLKQDRQAHLPQGTEIVLGLTEPVDLTLTTPAPRRFEAAGTPTASVSVAPVKPSAAKSYVAPQAFVPTN